MKLRLLMDVTEIIKSYRLANLLETLWCNFWLYSPYINAIYCEST